MIALGLDLGDTRRATGGRQLPSTPTASRTRGKVWLAREPLACCLGNQRKASDTVNTYKGTP